MSKRFSVVALALLVLVLTAPTLVAQLVDKTPRSTAEATSALSATSEVLEQVSKLRGLPIKRPVKSGIKSRAEIEKMVLEDLKTSNSAEEIESSRKVLVKLGMIAPDFPLQEYLVKLYTEQIAGFYEPRTKEFYLADWIPIAEQRIIMAHELTHALQDQYFDLGRFKDYPKHQSDSELAIHAMIEGEATVMMLSWREQVDARRLPPFDLNNDGGNSDERYPIFENAPLILRENIVFPYFYGASFVQTVLRQSSWQTITNGYQNLPTSTEQILHPEKFLAREQPIGVTIGDLAKLLGPDWRLIDHDVTGEFNYRLLLEQFIGRRRAQQAANGWGGDKYVAYENRATGEILIAQLTYWDTPSDAREFFQAYEKRVELRYSKLTKGPRTADALQWQTAEGDVLLQLRGNGVLVIEGGPAASHQKIAPLIWQSKTSPVETITIEAK